MESQDRCWRRSAPALKPPTSDSKGGSTAPSVAPFTLSHFCLLSSQRLSFATARSLLARLPKGYRLICPFYCRPLQLPLPPPLLLLQVSLPPLLNQLLTCLKLCCLFSLVLIYISLSLSQPLLPLFVVPDTSVHGLSFKVPLMASTLTGIYVFCFMALNC